MRVARSGDSLELVRRELRQRSANLPLDDFPPDTEGSITEPAEACADGTRGTQAESLE
jgi:hypothetical protein